MTETITNFWSASERHQIRGEHWREDESADLGHPDLTGYCHADKQSWPCLVAVACDALDALDVAKAEIIEGKRQVLLLKKEVSELKRSAEVSEVIEWQKNYARLQDEHEKLRDAVIRKWLYHD